MGRMKTVPEIIDAAGDRIEIAKECGVEPIAVYRWHTKGAIPAWHHAGVLRVAQRNGANITADMLCMAHDKSPASSAQKGAA
ncbi:carph-isopro domain-containing protein [Sagittula sp. S175]|uniref:carph-isopro domain-containing protein n=1 Tax=Sagittula sp. S175 TaxID=3415129 RepID=UPI003C7CD1F3